MMNRVYFLPIFYINLNSNKVPIWVKVFTLAGRESFFFLSRKINASNQAFNVCHMNSLNKSRRNLFYQINCVLYSLLEKLQHQKVTLIVQDFVIYYFEFVVKKIEHKFFKYDSNSLFIYLIKNKNTNLNGIMMCREWLSH